MTSYIKGNSKSPTISGNRKTRYLRTPTGTVNAGLFDVNIFDPNIFLIVSRTSTITVSQ